MKKDNFNYHFKNCLDSGVTITPEYFSKDQKIGDNFYKADKWYICVNNNGTKIYYNKVIGAGKTLRSKKNTKRKKTDAYDWGLAIKKTLEFWSNKIDNI